MTLKTQAIVTRDAYEAGGWRLEDVTVREPNEGELLVEMTASGICHSDLTTGGMPNGVRPGHYPQVFGHEARAGYVKAVGPGVTKAVVGDPVLCSFATCGSCHFCKEDEAAHCDDFLPQNVGHYEKIFGTVEDGDNPSITGAFFGHSSFARLSIVRQSSIINARDLIRSKDELKLFAPLGCGIQTGSGSITNVAKASPDDVVCVIGLGGVGLGAVMAAKLSGCIQIIGIDLVQSRLDLGKELGCTDVVNPAKLGADVALKDHVRTIADSVGPTITVDTTGVANVIETGILFTRRGGKYLQVGIPKDPAYEVKFNVLKALWQGIWFIAALEGHATPSVYVPKMIQWYREGKFPIDKLNTYFKAADWEQGTKGMLDGTAIKPVIVWNE